ncbi:hypothetical protein [uncultured Methanobrevibacter sp.]|uniref:hypothetical protein n=1 Tax=uncultured Methanobrevibacter sp. TaxID=253161 RepID=UPI00260D7C57|nr:hypothetical protein [uncultured Methanobrevibacter sp.]
MNFEIARNSLYEHFEKNMASRKLFRVDYSREDLWDIYLSDLPEEINPLYLVNPVHKCSACHTFFRQVGNVVALDEENYELITLFGCDVPDEYSGVFKKLDEELKASRIVNVFKYGHRRAGQEYDNRMLEDGSVVRFEHFYIDIPQNHIGYCDDISEAKTNRAVLESSTNKISIEAVDTVLELIATNSLYRGSEWEKALKKFRAYLVEFEGVGEKNRDMYFWKKSMELGPVVVRIKNKSIGTLLMDITQEMPLDEAVERYEQIVAPTNYKRPKPVFTQKMVDRAHEKIAELGFEESIQRRFAVLEDLSVNDVLFANRNVTPRLKSDVTVFDRLKGMALKRPRSFDKVEEIPVGEFVENVLPFARDVELYLKYDLTNNFVSLIGPKNADAPTMFKWNNLFSWTYKNNLADSIMKQRVKAMGGDVDVDLRFTIQWNEGEWDKNDLDAHCSEPDGEEIYFRHMKSTKTGGWLDVDIINPEKGEPAVENIQFKDRYKMIPGDYLFRVHQYTYRGGDSGFEAEIEFDGKIYRFNYPFKVNQKEYIDVAKVTLHDDYTFTIKSFLDAHASNIEEWGLNYNTFVPVSLICWSPNHWSDNKVGNKHIFFMLNECVSDERPRPWFNEYLVEELAGEHKRVMEALGYVARVEESDNQLSGIGFSLTQRNRVTLKVKTENIERLINVVM